MSEPGGTSTPPGPPTPDATASATARALSRLLGIAPAELPAFAAGFAMFLLAGAGYFMLRPVREAMGIAGGVDNLQWLFTATFVVTLAFLPLFGTIAATVPRRRILPWTYAFVAATLVLFAAAIAASPENPWIARAFYVWVSVFNMLVLSVGWSVLADLMPPAQAGRMFAAIAAGVSTGGLVGPLLGIALVGTVGIAGLLVCAAMLLVAAAAAAGALQRWRDAHPLPTSTSGARHARLGGNPLAGFGLLLKSRYLLGIGAFVVLLASVTTFLYFEQARLVELHFPDPEAQVRVFAWIDTAVQALALATQLFLTGRLVHRLGLAVLLAAVPLAMAAGFLWLAFAPTFAVFVAVMIARRAGEYALARPGREMLFTVVAPEEKYKAKNFIDTAVYRGADSVSAWVRTGIDAIAPHPAAVMLAGAVIALAWAACGVGLARGHARRNEVSPSAD